MKKILLILGIMCVIVCVLSLLFAALNLQGYHNVLDGSANLYNRLHQRMIIFFIVGIVSGAAGTACMIIQSKI